MAWPDIAVTVDGANCYVTGFEMSQSSPSRLYELVIRCNLHEEDHERALADAEMIKGLTRIAAETS
jgi:hypothetical protein